MKIAFISPLDLNLYLFRLPWINALKAEGFEVCCILPKNDDTDKTEAEGIKVIHYHLNRQSLNPLQGIFTIASLYRIFRKEHFHVIHTFTIKVNIYGAIAAKLAGVPIVITQVTGLGYLYTSHTFKVKLLRLLSNLLYKLIFRLASKIIFQNQDDLNTMKKLLNANKTIVIKGSGIDTEYYSISNVDKNKMNDLKNKINNSGKIVITLIARLYWSKGIKEFIEAANLIHDKFKNTLFLIVGWQDKGSPEVIPGNFIKKHSCEFIKFLGKRDDIKELLSITDIYALPSYREGLPHSILEAMSMGLPIVTTQVPGCVDVVENGINGLLVPPKDSKKLADAIIKLILDEALRNKLGYAGRDKAIELFSNKIILKDVLNLYVNLIPMIRYEDGLLIRMATLDDCQLIAKMHKQCLPQSFLSSLGLGLLTLFYKGLFKYRNGIILIAEENDMPFGFTTGVTNIKDFRNYFLSHNFIKLIFLLFPRLFSLNTLKKIQEDLTYTKGIPKISMPDAELISLAVNTDYRSKGAGKRLFENLVKEFKLRNIHEFKILVGGINGSEEFFRKIGCQRICGLKFHNKAESSIYTYSIK